MTRSHPWLDLLPLAGKPQQYVGCEWNAPASVPGRPDVTLVYPDTYELGMSNFGLSVVGHLLRCTGLYNVRRAFCPAPDMLSMLVDASAGWVCVDDAFPVGGSAVLGFGLPSEVLYSNVLRLLDLGGIPRRSSSRTADHPIVLAGGGGLSNPLPLAPFVDVFYLGEAEGRIEGLLAVLTGPGGRIDRIERAASIPGVWVPRLGRMPVEIQRAPVLRAGWAPVSQIVPTAQVAHDRAVVEIARGCSRGCRFCQATQLSRPVRERGCAEILDILERTLDDTGWEEAGLLSLSFSDYTALDCLMKGCSELERSLDVGISRPSLRPDTLARLVPGGRIHGRVTMAPEAGTAGMRNRLNKPLSDQEILEAADCAYGMGATGLKLYFMIGLPGETAEDLEGIASLARRICGIASRRRKAPRKAVTVALSPFVPKPHTPLQWAPQIPVDEMWRRIRRIEAAAEPAQVSWNDPGLAVVEAVLGLGDDIETPALLERAVELGACFDGWSDRFDREAWTTAIREHPGVGARILAGLPAGAPLPWSFVSTGVGGEYLVREYHRYAEGAATPDCRSSGCHGCGACDGSAVAPAPGPVAGAERAARVEQGGEPCILRIWYGRRGLARFFSHLDMVRLWMRATRRAGIRARARGEHVRRPRMRFGPALPLGFSSRAECLDVILDSPPPPGTGGALARSLPGGFFVTGARLMPLSTPAPDRQAAAAVYSLAGDARMAALLAACPGVISAVPDEGVLRLTVDLGVKTARPDRLLESLGAPPVEIERIDLCRLVDGSFTSLFEAGEGEDIK